MHITISGSGTKCIDQFVLCSYNQKRLSATTIFWLITCRVLFKENNAT